jgi:predicted PurR-regulated permease PerM
MVPPLAGLGPTETASGGRYAWLTAERLPRVRAILLALTLFFGLVVWILHSLGPAASRGPEFVNKLRGVGVLTWLYALVQMLDMRFYHSRFVQKRLATGIPESLLGWLLGQMLAWFGIVYYGLTQDIRWYAAGLVFLLLSFAVFPIRRRDV